MNQAQRDAGSITIRLRNKFKNSSEENQLWVRYLTKTILKNYQRTDPERAVRELTDLEQHLKSRGLI